MKDTKETKATEKKSFKEFMGSFRNRRFKGGIFTFAVCMVVIALVIILNVFVDKLNVTADLTANSLYSITDESKNFAKGLTDKIRFYYFAETGTENQQIKKIVEKYEGLGSDMKIVYVDPVLHPNYATGLVGTEEASKVGSDTVIVVNETKGRSKVLPASELIKTEYSMNYSTYSYDETYSIDVENEIDSALLYVTTDKLPKIYSTTGHGEISLGSNFTGLLDDNNFTVEELDTMTISKIPEDCDVLFIYLPQYDFTEDEVTRIKTYLDAGGKAVINCSYVNSAHTNFKELLDYYGLKLVDGTVIETDSKRYMSGTPYYLLPNIETADVTSGIKGVRRVFAPYASGLVKTDDARAGLSVTAVLTTSDTAFSKVDTESSVAQKVEGVDIDGPFMVGAFVSTAQDSGIAELYVYSVYYLFDESLVSTSSYGNADLCMNSFKTLADIDASFNISPKSTDVAYLVLTEAQIKLHRTVKMIAIPALCLVAGIVIWIRRRRAV